jgi:RNA 2',3'-cyclic 3'-phosphodiesterase
LRLFIAVNFDESIKDQLCDIINRISGYAVKGNFTKRENLHLTLVFIGEVPPDKTDMVVSAMKTAKFKDFDITLQGIGCFKRDGGDIWWVGVHDPHSCLFVIYKQLYESLTEKGFVIDNRDYKPHLTLGREVVLNDSFDKKAFSVSIPEIKVHVDKVSLMKSERPEGRLTYSEVFALGCEQ